MKYLLTFRVHTNNTKQVKSHDVGLKECWDSAFFSNMHCSPAQQRRFAPTQNNKAVLNLIKVIKQKRTDIQKVI